MSDGRLTDDDLARLISCRDEAALSTLYDRYARQAYAVALLVTNDPGVAWTVVEALFWEFWRRGATPVAGSSVRNGLMLSARRLAERTRLPA